MYLGVVVRLLFVDVGCPQHMLSIQGLLGHLREPRLHHPDLAVNRVESDYSLIILYRQLNGEV